MKNHFVLLQNHKNQSHVKFWASELVKDFKMPRLISNVTGDTRKIFVSRPSTSLTRRAS